MVETAALVIFPLLMVFSAFSDLFTMTIPNRVSALLVVTFFALAAYLPLSWEALLAHLSCGAAVLALTFVLFHFGWVGGGDAKLASATALWLGWGSLLDYGVIASLFGGALTVAVVLLRWYDLPKALTSV
ncbi:MAG: prepilin peptidase, partial [Methylocystis sp.]|nr:prepilin peptidase [Methylocystis sp.]